MKVLVGVNTLENVNSFVYGSHCQLWATMRKQYPKDDFLFYTPYRMSIDGMRNDAARIALEQDCDYLFFIDDDVVVRPDTFKSLLEAKKDIIMAITFIRGWPFKPMFFKDISDTEDVHGKKNKRLTTHDDWEETLVKEGDDAGLVKTGAVGFSCVLINMDIVRAMTPPYFVTGPGHTEDVYFCLRARAELEPEPEIWVDTRVPTGHMLMPDMVTLDNVKKLREFYAPEITDAGIMEYRMKKHLDNVIQEMAPLEAPVET